MYAHVLFEEVHISKPEVVARDRSCAEPDAAPTRVVRVKTWRLNEGR